LKRKYIGIEEFGHRIWRVYYYNVFLGYVDDLNIREKQIAIRLSLSKH
jgi:hypothetical protein